MEKRRNIYGIRVHEGGASEPKAAKQGGWQADHSERMDGALGGKEAEGKSDAVLQRIIDTATADEFVWDGKEFITC